MFLYPQLLLLLLLLPFLTGVKLLTDARARRASGAVIAPRLRPYLLPGSRSVGNAARWVAHALQILALALLIVALARPQWGFTESETQGEGRDILIAIDTSRSMLADDLQPSRLARARLTARDLIASLPSDRFGLMAFAGRAFLQAPLTIDHEAVSETIGQIDSETIPRGGSNLSEPLELAIKTFEKSESKDHALIIFSDGDEREGIAKDIAPKARKAGIMVIAVGVGSETGAIIPDPENEGQFITNNKGEVVRTRLQSGSLSALAKSTGGAYLELDAGNSTPRRISDALRTLSKSQHTAKTNRRAIERFQWPLGGAILCTMLSLAIPAILAAAPASGRRRSTTGALVSALALCLIPSEADASSLLRSAGRAFVNGEFSEAFEKLTKAREDSIGNESRSAAIAYSAGVAAYKMEDYQLATESFGQALSGPDESIYPEAFYNLGNTLYRRGEAIKALTEDPERKEEMNLSQQIELLNGTRMMWQEAIEQFDETLALEPEHPDALYNKEFIQKLLNELEQELEQKKQQQQQQQQQGQEGQEGQEGQDGSQGQQGDQGQEGQNGQQGKNGQEGQNGQDGENPGGKGGQEGEDGEGGKNNKENSKPSEAPGESENGRSDVGGKLEARNQNPGQGQGGSGQNSQGERSSTDNRVDPETGFSKDQARALIRAYTDEDTQARPPERIKTDGNYDNW